MAPNWIFSTARMTPWLASAGWPTAVWAQPGSGQVGPHMWDGGWHGWIFGPIMMIVFIAVAVMVVVLLVRWLGGSGLGAVPHAPSGKAPLEILRERFARGEIDKEEFEERLRVVGE